ncbi:cyclin-like protein [Sphaerosporella brunnea]|uniref:B-related factor 1 n=1 Tax=Sphaerosporella brunnea TaxID=1250544 RepID=A0A5J5EK60_9PEZI|nr:cyclin-like protein [Sphaerosporella brunnea]
MPSTCPNCGCSNPADFDDSSGQVVCTNCGTVVNESHIVSEISFGENSAGAATVQGSFVGAGQTHASTGGRYRSGTSIEAREATIADARRRMAQLAVILHCPEHFIDQAQRWFTLAITNNFTRGRKSQYVIACCLYIACRMERSSHMLIDFSDVLQINVFTLGQTYLKMVAAFQLHIPNIDPAVYVHRFAKHLEFGNDQFKVAQDALRLIKRMNRDWMVQGRRPSGICGAALILAARMNNFRRSVREVVYVVKVADLTINKRLQEFKETNSGNLTVQEFRSMWLEQEHDPPSFGPKKKKRKRVRQVNDDGEVIDDPEDTAAVEPDPKRVKGKEVRRDKDGFVVPEIPVDPALISMEGEAPLPTPPSTEAAAKAPESDKDKQSIDTPESDKDKQPAQTELDKEKEKQEAKAKAAGIFIPDEQSNSIIEATIESEISSLVNDQSSSAIVEELRQAHEAALAALPKGVVSDDPDNLHDVDDDWEVQGAILNDQEVEIKERVWTEFNKDWIRDQEIKRLKTLADARNGIVKNQRKRKKNKPRDSSAPDLAASPAESATRMLKRRAYSKKINYKAIEGLFED